MTGIEFESGVRRVSVVDTIENTDFVIQTPERIDPEPVDDDVFYFPVDHGVTFEASGVVIPQSKAVYVYDLDEEKLAENTTVGAEITIRPGRYEIDFLNTPMKFYLQVESSVEVQYKESKTHLLFDDICVTRIGARSLHNRPADTVVGTRHPEGMMKAVSTFSSALKTLTPERSFPTLRGHPPELTVGPELSIPASIEAPDTGVTIGIERDLSQVYTVAPLTFYLAAEIVPTDGGEPYIDAAGTRLSLDRGNGFTDGVHRTLERQFIFDCVLRTEGLYAVDLHERNVMQEEIDLDFAATYDLPIEERVATCFDLPAEAFARPSSWNLVADVAGDLDNANLLPYFVKDLAHVRSDEYTEQASSAEPTSEEIQNFMRNRGAPLTRSTEYRSGSSENESADRNDILEEVVTPPESDALGHAWADDYFPIGAAKPTVDSFQRRHDAISRESPLTKVTVVCNEESMRGESNAMYGFRDVISLNVEVLFDIDTEGLREVLKRDTDFFHYIGHVDDHGMQCPDGALDLQSLEYTGVDAFFLNACESYEQGMALLDAGARGGIVTVADVYNVIATKFGRRVARLMDAGFDLYGALDVGQDGTLAGGSYAIVGDGRTRICEPTDGMPMLYEIKSENDGEYAVNVHSYPTLTYDIGTMTSFSIDSVDLKYIECGTNQLDGVNSYHLDFLLEEDGIPVQIDEELYWSDNVKMDDLP